jgi:hypothetical protein
VWKKATVAHIGDPTAAEAEVESARAAVEATTEPEAAILDVAAGVAGPALAGFVPVDRGAGRDLPTWIRRLALVAF